MPIIPLRLTRTLQPWLTPLRWLADHHWLRASDVDACLGFLQPTWALTRIHARVEARRWVAQDMLAIRLRPNGNWPGAQAGQHVQLFIERNGVRLSRSYSLTAQADGCIEIAVRRQPEGRVSAWLCEHLSVGDCVELGSPYGELRWPQEGAVLLAAAGSGITPLLGLLRDALGRGFSAPVRLLHFVREQGQRAFVEELQQLQARYPNLAVEWAVTAGPSGQRLNAEQLHEWREAHVLSCGPAGFVEQLRELVDGQAASLQVESFTPPQWRAEGERRPVRLQFARSQREAVGDNQTSLLAQAEAAGLKPEHGCRQGICTQCTCQLLEGAVRDLRSGEISHEPGQSIRICVSAPLGDVRVDL